MTDDLHPQQGFGANVWPTRPAVPGQSSHAGTQQWPSSAPSAHNTIKPHQVWQKVPTPTIAVLQQHVSAQPQSSDTHRTASADARASSAMYPALIWLGIMLIALTILLLSFVLWERPVTHLQGAPNALVSRIEALP